MTAGKTIERNENIKDDRHYGNRCEDIKPRKNIVFKIESFHKPNRKAESSEAISETSLSVINDVGAQESGPSDLHFVFLILSSFSCSFMYQAFASLSFSNLIAGIQTLFLTGILSAIVVSINPRLHIFPVCLSSNTEDFSSGASR